MSVYPLARPSPDRDRYPPIEDHGLIGDGHSAALVSTDGTLNWCCLPRFDSSAVFASLLDADNGGSWSLSVVDAHRTKQMYLPESNVLLTRFVADHGAGEVVDFMVPGRTGRGPTIVRRVQAVRGRVRVLMRCAPAFDFARSRHSLKVVGGVAHFRSPTGRFVLRSNAALDARGDSAFATFELDAGASVDFVLEWDGAMGPLAEHEVDELLEATLAYWRRWLRQCRYQGRWREMVERSALCLKLLVYQPTGALVAAPTTSLPEAIGYGRNWDYRYTWLRDAALTLSSLMRLGFVEEAGAFMDWLEGRCREAAEGGLQVLYGIDGRRDVSEVVLDHLEGYQGSRPVRVGNAAAGQLQLDITGEVMDAVHLYDQRGHRISYSLWCALSRQLDWLAAHWDKPDASIWEPRCGPKRFTYSGVMTWVAFDRALRLASERGFPAPISDWRRAAVKAYSWVQESGWDEQRRAYVQYPDSGRLDASLLTVPLVGFCGATDPRFLSTLDRIREELLCDSLVRRYEGDSWDGLAGEEGTFSLCSFWYVQALTRAGRPSESRLLFEKMLTYANHVGLYAEEISPGGAAVGNFPQAFTHLALVSTALNLDKDLSRRGL